MEFKTEKQIFTEMLEYARDNGHLNIDDDTLNMILGGRNVDNQYVLDLATHAKALSYLYDACSELYTDMNISTATGEALDRFGLLLGLPRLVGSCALVDVDVSLPVNSEDIRVPEGTPLIIEEVAGSDEYVTSEELVLNSGVLSGTVQCTSTRVGYRAPLQEGAVRGLSGFPTLTCTNPEDGTHGSDIEEDEDYRERIKQNQIINLVGTRACIESYLDSYEGLDNYSLIPLYDGVGTLKIVCDTLSSLLDTISDDVYTNCMMVSDVPPLCVLPEDTVLQSLEVSVLLDSNRKSTLTVDELRQLIESQIRTFVDGGLRRDGSTYTGMQLGADFVPSQLIRYLFGEVPECLDVTLDVQEIVVVPSENRFTIDELLVVIRDDETV